MSRLLVLVLFWAGASLVVRRTMAMIRGPFVERMEGPIPMVVWSEVLPLTASLSWFKSHMRNGRKLIVTWSYAVVFISTPVSSTSCNWLITTQPPLMTKKVMKNQFSN